MRKMFSNKTSVCNVICGVLVIVLLVLQLLPFWSFGEETVETASIQSYIWFPGENGALDKYLTAQMGDAHDLLWLVTPMVITFIGGVIGLVVILFRSYLRYAGVLPTLVGAAGVYAYLFKPALQLGGNWVLHLIVSIALLVCGVVSLWVATKEKKAAEAAA